MNSEFRIWNEELRKEYSHDIYPRVFEFACCVVRLHRTLAKKSVNRIPASQLLRAGTSVGANLEEANAAHSHADFVAKTRIALKEARESLYWLRLIEATDMAPLGDVHPARHRGKRSRFDSDDDREERDEKASNQFLILHSTF